MQNYGIFCQFRSKLAITHTIAIKWKEEYDAVVVDCHLSWQNENISLPKKGFFFLGRLPLLPGSHLGGYFSTQGDYFASLFPEAFKIL